MCLLLGDQLNHAEETIKLTKSLGAVIFHGPKFKKKQVICALVSSCFTELSVALNSPFVMGVELRLIFRCDRSG